MVITSARSLQYIQAGCFAASLLAANGPACARRESVLYSFKGGSDGALPQTNLVDVGGTLYGETLRGGTSTACNGGCGTLFSVTTSGVEKIVYAFQGGSDGGNPTNGLIGVRGNLFGTTTAGGTSNIGAVFRINPATGRKTIVHSFNGGSDGAYPDGGLIDRGGRLYGVTGEGGGPSTVCSAGCGTVFSVTPAGAEAVVYAFQCCTYGYGPGYGLANVNGTFYGFTAGGGYFFNGTIFSLTPAGVVNVLYSFLVQGDGPYYPAASFINVDGTLYGTSSGGSPYKVGSVFSVTPSGTVTLLYSFKEGTGDGFYPQAGLIEVNGKLYGTTSSGGAFGGTFGYGTIFSVTTAGAEKVVYSFRGGSDGAYPEAGLINVGGTLYGTTTGGGSPGSGTVFAWTP
jgi:uncharacterized repeat protein (TIGR03803 family)